MKYITIINFIIRLLGTVAIFVLIKVQNDFLKLAAINSLSQILVGVIGIIFVIKKFSIELIYPGFEQIKRQLRQSAYLFKSTIAINLYTNSNIFILGLLTNERVVGYYSAADKIRIAAQNLLGPVSQSIYPYVNYLVTESKEKFLRFNSKLLKLQGLFAFLISLVIFFLAKPISNVLFGAGFVESVNVLKILAWLPFVISISNVYGIQTMLPLNFERQFFYIVAFAAVINLVLLFTLIPHLNEIGATVSFLITEIIVTVSMAIFCEKKGFSLFNYGI
jgi:PST family polysaccharide transporter